MTDNCKNKRISYHPKSDLLSNPEVKSLIDSITEDYTYSLRELSHELGNILTLINSSLQIIESSHPKVTSFKYWSSTINDVHYMMQLLSELSAFNNGNKIQKQENIQLSSIIHNVIESFSSNPQYTKVTFINNVMVNRIPPISGDPTKLQQVFLNIIKNALEANCFTIRINYEVDEESVTLIIADDGDGLSPSQIDNIFKPMVSYKSSGTGLGLSVCERIISAHHGELICHSKQNIGTSFEIKLPIY